MIIGNGLLANGFMTKSFDHKDLVIFASGVSDSKNTSKENFNREKQLLIKTIEENKNLKLIYFSSILTNVQNNEYYNHKLEIENIISELSDNYIIFRVPQIIGNIGNKNNLVNFIKHTLLNNEEIVILKNTYRSIIDIEDLVNIVNYCKDLCSCQIINISEIEKISVIDLVNIMSSHLDLISKSKLIDGNDNNWLTPNSDIVDQSIDHLKINKNGYTNKVIKKYIN